MDSRIRFEASSGEGALLSHVVQPSIGGAAAPDSRWHSGISSFFRTSCTSKSYSRPTRKRTRSFRGLQPLPRGRKTRKDVKPSGPSRIRKRDWLFQTWSPQTRSTPRRLLREPCLLYTSPSPRDG